jgi:hypothetical protein
MVDLLSRIQRELQERMETLHPAVAERDRLRVELSALDASPEPLVVPEACVPVQVDPEPVVVSAASVSVDVGSESVAVRAVALESPLVRGPSADPGRFPVPRELPRRPAVSPKVARLMLAPRRPSLERAGIPRVGAGARAARKGRVEQTDAPIERNVASAA